MSENKDCKDCIYVKNMAERIETLENQDRGYEVRITALERQQDVEKERIKTTFKILNEIKYEISKMNESNKKTFARFFERVEAIEKRPAELFWTVLGGVIVAIIMAGLTLIG